LKTVRDKSVNVSKLHKEDVRRINLALEMAMSPATLSAGGYQCEGNIEGSLTA
jgi:hypothetical protein